MSFTDIPLSIVELIIIIIRDTRVKLATRNSIIQIPANFVLINVCIILYIMIM